MKTFPSFSAISKNWLTEGKGMRGLSNFRHLDALLQDFVKKGPAGCGCAVAQHGKMIYEGYFGYADLESKKQIDSDTVYRQYSMTKIAVYTLCMMLLEQGKFLLQDPVSDFFPEWKNMMRYETWEDGTLTVQPLKKPIRVEHIMNMSCGLPYGHYSDGSPTANTIYAVTNRLKERRQGYTLRDEIRAVAEVPVAFEPGTDWMYGFGSELAAGLIEVVTGKPIHIALKEALFDPMEMGSTGMLYFGDIQSRLATFYSRDDKGVLTPGGAMMDEKAKPAAPPSGCPRLFSTVRDFTVFTQMLANGGRHNGTRIMGGKTIDLMRQNRLNQTQLKTFRNAYLDGYGYGLGVRTLMSLADGNSNSSVGEFGWTGGSGTWASIDPSEGVSVVYMHQLAPNMEQYHHLRVRACAYGCLE